MPSGQMPVPTRLLACCRATAGACATASAAPNIPALHISGSGRQQDVSRLLSVLHCMHDLPVAMAPVASGHGELTHTSILMGHLTFVCTKIVQHAPQERAPPKAAIALPLGLPLCEQVQQHQGASRDSAEQALQPRRLLVRHLLGCHSSTWPLLVHAWRARQPSAGSGMGATST